MACSISPGPERLSFLGVSLFQAIKNFFKALFGSKVTVVTPIPPVIPSQSAQDKTPWMTLAVTYEGQPTVTGEAATPFDEMIFSHVDDDELTGHIMKSGCAAFVTAMLDITGYQNVRTCNAKRMATVGSYVEFADAGFGDMLVFTGLDGPGSFHATFFYNRNSDGTINAFGANQNHKVKHSNYKASMLYAVRRPEKK